MENYETNPTIMKRCLDPLRSAEFPYDIQAFLVSPTRSAEIVWYRPTEMHNFTLKGILLNEPDGAFGMHKGNVVCAKVSFQDGKIVAVLHGFPNDIL